MFSPSPFHHSLHTTYDAGVPLLIIAYPAGSKLGNRRTRLTSAPRAALPTRLDGQGLLLCLSCFSGGNSGNQLVHRFLVFCFCSALGVLDSARSR